MNATRTFLAAAVPSLSRAMETTFPLPLLLCLLLLWRCLGAKAMTPYCCDGLMMKLNGLNASSNIFISKFVPLMEQEILQ
jgi:hypothetical protein